MRKVNKRLCGWIGLIVVAVMTVTAIFMPANPAAAESTQTDTLRVVVYDKFPEVKITSIESGESLVNPEITIDFLYENSEYVDFVLSYEDEDGNMVEIPLSRFNPDELDPTFAYASGEASVTLNLDDLGLGYNYYTITALSHSSIGYSEDIVDFYHVPASSTQIGEDEETQDPIIRVDYGDGVEKVEVIVYDENGNPVFDEPIVVNVPAPYNAGYKDVTLPLSSYGLPSGDGYRVELISYKRTEAVDDEGNPILDDEGNPVMILDVAKAPRVLYTVSYHQFIPEIPDTGQVFKNLNIAKSDMLITIALVMLLAVGFAIYTLTHKTKKDYRKRLRK